MDQITLREMPVQKKLYAEKDKEWRENCVDAVVSICNAFGRSRRSSNKQKRRNYNLFNNKIDRADFDYVLNPFNLSKEAIKEFQFPATLQPYDIVSNYFQLLMGEEMKRPFNPLIVAINEDAISEKQKEKKDIILKELESILTDAIQNQQQPEPEQLKKYKNYSPKAMRESIAEKLLNHYCRKDHLPEMWNAHFKDVLLAGEEIADVSQVADEPRVRRVNPMEIYFLLLNNSDKVDDAERIYERNRLTVSEIIDEFYEYLTPDQIDDLESYSQGNTTNYSYGPFLFNIAEVESIYSFEDDYGERGIPVHRVRWQSKKKVGSLHFLDENGLEQEQLVDETFKINKQDKSQWIEWFWINEYWEGTRIGQDMYLNIRPRKQQFRSIDNISKCKSGYVGTVYSCTNSQSVSLMDRLVPWIYLYLIIWYRTELAMAKNIGRLGLIDISLIPDDMEPEKWMYYAQAMGFGFVNPFNESNKVRGITGANLSTQNKELDLSQAAYIKNHIDLLTFIEQKIQDTSGITRQRLGEISSSELVGNTERAVTQSSHITEPYFTPHEYFKLRICEALIEVAKDCLEERKKGFQYITDDVDTVLFEVDGNDFNNADYGVFVSNISRDQQTLETLKQLLQAALQNDKVELSQVVDVLNTNSISDIKNKLIDAEEDRQEMIQQQQQAEQKHQQELQQQQIDFQNQELDRQSDEKQLDRENEIQIALIKSEGAAELKAGDSGVAELEGRAKIDLEQSKLEHQRMVDKRKFSLEKMKIDAENLRSQQELDKQHKHEKQVQNKELENKVKLERIKAKARPKKTGK